MLSCTRGGRFASNRTLPAQGTAQGSWLPRVVVCTPARRPILLKTPPPCAGPAGAAVWLRRGAGEEEGGPTGETIEEVDLKIDKARGLLRLLEKRHRVKAALSQKKLIERLQRRRKVRRGVLARPLCAFLFVVLFGRLSGPPCGCGVGAGQRRAAAAEEPS